MRLGRGAWRFKKEHVSVADRERRVDEGMNSELGRNMQLVAKRLTGDVRGGPNVDALEDRPEAQATGECKYDCDCRYGSRRRLRESS